MPLKTLLGLIIGNLIWSAHPMMGKFVLADFNPVQAAWLRYSTALLSFLVFRAILPTLRSEPFFFPKTTKEWITAAAVGAFAFGVTPLLQLTGLNASRAMDNALIVAMEPLITVLMAWLLIREHITRSYMVTFFIAIIGFALLTGISTHGLELSPAHFWGDVIIFLSLTGEALYSVGGRSLVERHSPISIYGLAILVGVIVLTLAAGVFGHETPISLIRATAHQMTWKSGLAIAYLGPLGTTASYIYWMYALKKAPVASVALTLFIQPLSGSLWGYLFLGERLTLSQSLGGALIIIAVFAQTLGALRTARLEQPVIPYES